MVRPSLTRRTLAGLGAAGLLAGPRALANIAQSTGSRLVRDEELPYEAPATLALISDLYSRMNAQLMVQGKGPFAFVVDTGANQSVISAELAHRLELPLGPSRQLNGVAGVSPAATVVADLTIGKRVRREVTLFVLPAAAIGGDGMLGLDGLEGQRLELDFRAQTMHIEAAGRKTFGPSSVAVRSRRRDGQLTLVDADVAGISVTAFIDSGAQNTIGNLALQRLARARRPTDLWESHSIISVTGQTIEAQIAALPHFRIGGLTLPFWPVAFADLHTFQMWKLSDIPAILVGVDVLSRFEQVSLDFAHDEVRFTPPNQGRMIYRSMS